MIRIVLEGISLLTASAKPFPYTSPNRMAISCNTIVAMIDKTIAHNNVKPNSTPVKTQTVTVPGPINAAAIKAPGPIFLNIFFTFIFGFVQVRK